MEMGSPEHTVMVPPVGLGLDVSIAATSADIANRIALYYMNTWLKNV